MTLMQEYMLSEETSLRIYLSQSMNVMLILDGRYFHAPLYLHDIYILQERSETLIEGLDSEKNFSVGPYCFSREHDYWFVNEGYKNRPTWSASGDEFKVLLKYAAEIIEYGELLKENMANFQLVKEAVRLSTPLKYINPICELFYNELVSSDV